MSVDALPGEGGEHIVTVETVDRGEARDSGVVGVQLFRNTIWLGSRFRRLCNVVGSG